MSPTLLIIGSRGQIGSIIGDYFQTLGFQIMTLNRVGDKSLPLLLKNGDQRVAQLGEASLRKNLTNIILNFNVTHVVHCASPRGNISSLSAVDYQLLHFANFELTNILIDSIHTAKTQTSLTFMGSSAMYEPTSNLYIVEENTIPNPTSVYGSVKNKAINLINEAVSALHINAHSLVLFNQESPLRPKGFLFHDLASQIASYSRGDIKEICVKDKYHTMDWSDARDLPSMLNLCFENKSFENYIVASGKLRTIESLILETAQLMQIDIHEGDIASATDKKSDRASLLGNSKKAYNLGWKGSRPASLTLSEFASKLQNKYSH